MMDSTDVWLAKSERYYQRRLELWQRTGAPARYFDLSLGNSLTPTWGQRGVLESCRAWLDDFDHRSPWGYPGLLLHGPRGTGKTHWACCILTAILYRLPAESSYLPVRFVVAANLMGRIADARRPHFDEEPHESPEDIFSDLGTCRLLFVDDLGNELHSWGQQEQAHWYRIVNDRYNNRLPIVVTTNAAPEDLWRHVGPAAASRLQEMVRLLPVEGRDMRQQDIVAEKEEAAIG